MHTSKCAHITHVARDNESGCRIRTARRRTTPPSPTGVGCETRCGRGGAHDCAKARRPPVPVAAAALVECCRSVCCRVAARARICARICWSPARSPANDDIVLPLGRQCRGVKIALNPRIPRLNVIKNWKFPKPIFTLAKSVVKSENLTYDSTTDPGFISDFYAFK
jgi:hypothetical protein